MSGESKGDQVRNELDDDLFRFRPGFEAGQIPGAAIYTGVDRDFEIDISVFDWTGAKIDEFVNATPEEAAGVRGRSSVSWVNVSGIHDAQLIREIGERFDLHPLSIEDILYPHQRPKFEPYSNYIYLVLKMAYELEDGTTKLEQFSMILGSDFLLTFQEEKQDVFEGVRKRLRNSQSRIRNRGHDYLAYVLMDVIVDNYVLIIERIESRMVDLETILDGASPELLRSLPSQLHHEKRELMAIRRAVMPLRDAVTKLGHGDYDWIQERNIPYFRDLHDHLVQLVDSIEIYREMIASIGNLHLSMVGQKTNEDMRVLTVIATIFIPLTFIAGVYGMNFEYMPELKVRWAYPAFWVIIFAIAGGLLFQFRRRHWL